MGGARVCAHGIGYSYADVSVGEVGSEELGLQCVSAASEHDDDDYDDEEDSPA